MNIGRKIKQKYGVPTEVEWVLFDETDKHIVLRIISFDKTLKRQETLDVLDRYALGNWIWVETRCEMIHGPHFNFRYGPSTHYSSEGLERQVSVYRVDKEDILSKL